MPNLFDGISIEEIGEFAEVNEDLSRAYRMRDESIQTSPLREANNTQTDASSAWVELKTIPSCWIPAWATEMSVIAQIGSTNASSLVLFRLRCGGITGPEISIVDTTSGGIRRELIMPITSQAGGYHVIDIQGLGNFAFGTGARLWTPETILTFRSAA